MLPALVDSATERVHTGEGKRVMGAIRREAASRLPTRTGRCVWPMRTDEDGLRALPGIGLLVGAAPTP